MVCACAVSVRHESSGPSTHDTRDEMCVRCRARGGECHLLIARIYRIRSATRNHLGNRDAEREPTPGPSPSPVQLHGKRGGTLTTLTPLFLVLLSRRAAHTALALIHCTCLMVCLCFARPQPGSHRTPQASRMSCLLCWVARSLVRGAVGSLSQLQKPSTFACACSCACAEPSILASSHC